MQKSKIWLSSPHMGENELAYIQEAFRTNWIAPLGPHVNEFEKRLATSCGSAHAAALSSGTAALHLGLIILGVQPGDYVICQSMTFSASANPIKYMGANPVFIDSEADSWNMSPGHLEEALLYLQETGKSAKAIIPVHLYGMPAKMNEIKAIARRYDVPILEDAAEALGSRYYNKPCGSLGEMGVLSFNGNKIITTSGGGALMSNRQDWIDKARFLATQARDPAPHYQHSLIGYNYRLSNVLAGIGLGQMEVLPKRIEQRRSMHEWYRNSFREWQNRLGSSIYFQEETDGFFSNRWLTCILVDPYQNNGLSREAIRLHLEKYNIESRPLWKPMHMQPVFENEMFFGSGLSDKLFEQGLCLPSGSNLSANDKERIFAALESIMLNYLR